VDKSFINQFITTMAQIATTIEQSKKLVELGLSADTADMYYPLPCDESDLPQVGECCFGCTPAWSLSALIELMPNKICIDNENYHINFNKKEVAYKGRITWEGQLGITIIDDNLINAVFKMICYLLENNFLKH
jgi:hypothetical protein